MDFSDTHRDQRSGTDGSRPPYLSSSTDDDPVAGTAVVTITDQSGTTRAFRCEWASPEYLIPVIAHALIWFDKSGHRLVTSAWLAYAEAFPGTLPLDEVTGTEAADDTFTGDLGYRYQLYLDEDSAGVLLRVYRVREPRREPGPQLIVELTRADLFAEAAALCDVMADRAQRWADSHGGDPPAGNDPDVWRRHASRFRRLDASTPIVALGANLDARLVPATFDVPYPAIEVAGVSVFAYLDPHGTVRITAHLDEAQPWLLRRDRTVPVQVTIDGRVVFQG